MKILHTLDLRIFWSPNFCVGSGRKTMVVLWVRDLSQLLGLAYKPRLVGIGAVWFWWLGVFNSVVKTKVLKGISWIKFIKIITVLVSGVSQSPTLPSNTRVCQGRLLWIFQKLGELSLETHSVHTISLKFSKWGVENSRKVQFRHELKKFDWFYLRVKLRGSIPRSLCNGALGYTIAQFNQPEIFSADILLRPGVTTPVFLFGWFLKLFNNYYYYYYCYY